MNVIKKIYYRFKSWMRYDPPGSMTSKGWRLFEKEYKENAPIRHWIMHDLKYSTIMPVKWKFEKAHDWIRYRTYDQYHKVDTGLVPGYYDIDHIMLNVNFNILKEFVEVEQAWSKYLWSGEYKEKASWFEKHMPLYRFFYPFRRPDLGIAYLEWAATLDDPNLPPHERCDHQAVSAREILALYRWWTVTRPARKELDRPSYSDQGLGIMSSLDDDFDHEAEDFKVHEAYMEASEKLQTEWREEDDAMLIRLTKIRKDLWT